MPAAGGASTPNRHTHVKTQARRLRPRCLLAGEPKRGPWADSVVPCDASCPANAVVVSLPSQLAIVPAPNKSGALLLPAAGFSRNATSLPSFQRKMGRMESKMWGFLCSARSSDQTRMRASQLATTKACAVAYLALGLLPAARSSSFAT